VTVFPVPTQQNLPWYITRISLSGTVYTLRFRYNSRMQRWILDIADASNNDLINGLPILINQNVNGQYVITGLPPGFFFAIDTTQQDMQPTLNSFGTINSLFYSDPTQ
jgi:hypothetical protein